MGVNPLRELEASGVSVWLDFIDREILASGGLARLIAEDGVSGLTSNPSIFEKAITAGGVYAETSERLAREGRSLPEIYRELVFADIRDAARLFQPVFERTDGLDGWVSLEVSPLLATRAEDTVAEAERLADELGLENLFIKVPATPEGYTAIEELTFRGRNVNATLIFSPEQYRRVAEAYIRGLERRLAAGKPLSPRQGAVASFFVSRIDTLADRRLADAPSLRGRMALAVARRAYGIYRDILASERFRVLAQAGARPQRLLWASTSTKNPEYSDVLYVSGLVGPDTVNTLPLATLEAFRDHGRVERNLPGDDSLLAEFARHGLDPEAVGRELLSEGVTAFVQSYRRLLEAIRRRGEAVTPFFGLGAARPVAEEALRELEARRAVERLHAKDGSLWGLPESDGPRYLGWLDLPAEMPAHLAEIRELGREIETAGLNRIVLLGMGGSSLGADALARIRGRKTVTVLDSTAPEAVAAALVDAPQSFFIVASKSGTTGEIQAFFAAAWERVRAVKGERAGENFAAITDPGTPLATLAREHRFRRVFANPPALGGRYSVLSYFGLVLGGLAGADLEELLATAAKAADESRRAAPENPAALLGAVLGGLGRNGRDKVTLVGGTTTRPFGDWAEQLLAESTGKLGRGLVPVVGEETAESEAYGTDRIFVDLGGIDVGEDRIPDLLEAGQPVFRVPFAAESLGACFFRWEAATALAGALLGVNPFDQPDVEKAKVATRRILSGEGSFAEPPVLANAGRYVIAGSGEAGSPAGVLRAFLDSVRPGDYLALQAFLAPKAELDELFGRIRRLLRDSLRVATTFGYGPRFLHSTGQVHKGGPPSGVFWQFDADEELEIPIPGEDYGFGRLKRAQALGDYVTLKEEGRRIRRFRLLGEPSAALADLLADLERLLKG